MKQRKRKVKNKKQKTKKEKKKRKEKKKKEITVLSIDSSQSLDEYCSFLHMLLFSLSSFEI